MTIYEIILDNERLRAENSRLCKLVDAESPVGDKELNEQEKVLRRDAQLVQMLETARQISLDILFNRAGEEALQHIVQTAASLSHATYAALGIANHDKTGLISFITTGLTFEEKASIGFLPRGSGILGLLLTRDKPLRIDVMADHPSSSGFPPNHPPMKSFLGVPIRRGEEVLGSLYLTDRVGGGGFTEADETAITALADYAAVALHYQQILSGQRDLVSGLIKAQEEERRSVAYDLHDGLTQYVMASHAFLDTFLAGYQEGLEREVLLSGLETGVKYLQEAVIESRRLVNGLRSLALDDMGLAGALEQFLSEEKERAGWSDAKMIHNIADIRFGSNLETTIFRVAQEAISNIRKHANTERLLVLLRYEHNETPVPSSLQLEVQDWGTGFNLRETRSEAHVGLHSMKERIRLMNGTLSIESEQGVGTLIKAIFPVQTPV